MVKHGGTDDAAWYSMMKHGALAIINQLLCCRMNTYHTTQYDYVTGYQSIVYELVHTNTNRTEMFDQIFHF